MNKELPKLVLITGVSGAGKSTISQRLNELGYEAYDADNVISRWETHQGQPVDFEVTAEQITADWEAMHHWNMSVERIRVLQRSPASYRENHCKEVSADYCRRYRHLCNERGRR